MVFFMYNAQDIATRIKGCAKKSGVPLRQVLTDCGLNVNTLNQLTDRKGLSSVSACKIADYLNVSVDYLLGRSDNPTMTMPPADIDTQTADGAALLAIYNRLSPVDRAKLLLYADNLTRNGGNDGNGSKDGGI